MDFTEEGNLNALVWMHPYFTLLEIEGIVDNGSTLRLGHVELDKTYPGYRAFAFGCSSELAPSSLFRAMPFDVPSINRSGIAAIFCATNLNGTPEEYFAGWVHSDQKADLEKWIKQMNKHIQRMLSSSKTEQTRN